MAHSISRSIGKGVRAYNKVFDNKVVSEITTSPINKLWRAKILLNRLTSRLPKNTALKHGWIPNKSAHSLVVNERVSFSNSDINKQRSEERLARGRIPLLIGSSSVESLENPLKYPRVIVKTISQIQEEHKANKEASKSFDDNIYIINTSPNGEYAYIQLQNRPPEVVATPEPFWAAIKSMGRNVPMYHYTGAEDSLDFSISWYHNNPEDGDNAIFQRCQLLESWSKANSYIAAPPILQIRWGSGDMFKGRYFILVKCNTTYSNFQSGYKDRRGLNPIVKSRGLNPMVAVQELSFKRVSGENLGYGDYYNIPKQISFTSKIPLR